MVYFDWPKIIEVSKGFSKKFIPMLQGIFLENTLQVHKSFFNIKMVF